MTGNRRGRQEDVDLLPLLKYLALLRRVPMVDEHAERGGKLLAFVVPLVSNQPLAEERRKTR